MKRKQKSNLNKLYALLFILLIVGLATSLSTTMASNGSGSGQGEQYGSENNSAPTTNPTATSNQTTNASTFDNAEHTRQYNRTDVTPKGEMEQVRAREQTMFQYRNMTMLVNCTQNCTVSFTADEELTPNMFGLSVDPNQTMTLAMNLTKSPLNGAMVNERCLNFYLGIEPNATLQLQAQIRLYINQTELNQNMNREVNASRLTWMYWNQTSAQWKNVQSYMDSNGYLVCNTNHFSIWTVAELEPAEATSTPTTQNGAYPIEYIIAGTAVVIALVVIGIVVVFKKFK
jgi:hypothetical protein